jgi:uncharacterized protein YndB with AHSA1/START domain
MRTRPHLIALLALLVAGDALAEVKASAATGFIIEERVEIKASAEDAFRALTEVERWWNPEHTYSGKAENLHIELRPDGCFCETLPNGGFVRHLELAMVMPPKLLRFTGGLGPLLGLGATGTLSMAVKPGEDGKVTVSFRYVVTGFDPAGFDKTAAAVDGVLAEQLARYAKLFGV